MELFYGGGGRSNPDFTYQFELKAVTESMFEWCSNYPLTGPFERWYIRYGLSNDVNSKPVIQIESRKAAYLFKLAFSEYITKDLTYSFAKDHTW